MLSVASWSPQVMKIFWPCRAYVPSPFGVAVAVRAPRSDPAPGSVSTMAPVHSPLTSFDR